MNCVTFYLIINKLKNLENNLNAHYIILYNNQKYLLNMVLELHSKYKMI